MKLVVWARRLWLDFLLGAFVLGGLPPASAVPALLHVDRGALATPDGVPVALYGVNLFQSHLGWSRRQRLAEVVPQLAAIAAHGFNAVRMPLNMAWFEPDEGIFPDSPRYAEIMRKHRLPTGAVAFYDAIIRTAGDLGLYVIPEFHELPVDPYRYFVGGREQDRKTGKPGTAIAWLAVRNPETGKYSVDWTRVRRELPHALGWLADHWKGVPNIAGIEVPWNEPRGPLTEPGAYFDLVQACADAVKSADPDRLVFMDCLDWGAMVNRLPDESLWKVPGAVDGLMPHFYPGLHSSNSGPDGTWSTTMANWASWFGGSGKVVMVGEYGVVEMRRARYWRSGVTSAEQARTYAACVAQWYAMGIRGLFGWAWQGGIGVAPHTGRLLDGAEELAKWAEAFRSSPYTLARARIAVVCARRRRAQYGGRKDLWKITDALLDAGLTPFATVFPSQIRERPSVLRRFAAIIVYEPDIPGDVRAVLRSTPNVAGWLKEDLANLDLVLAKSSRRVPQRPDPPGLIIGRAPGGIAVFNRRATRFDGCVPIHLPWMRKTDLIVVQDHSFKWTGPASDLARVGLRLSLGPWECRKLSVHKAGARRAPGAPAIATERAGRRNTVMRPAQDSAAKNVAIDSASVKRWSARFRGWRYWPDYVVSAATDPDLKFQMVDCPLIFQRPDDAKWYMFYTGFDGRGYQTALAESNDLLHWKPRGLVMSFGKPGAYDHGGVTFGGALFESYDLDAPRVLKRWNGRYWALYGCYPKQGGYEIRPGAEGVASSKDGLTWRRESPDRPILSVNGAARWEKDCIYQPWLIEHNGKFWDFYNAANGGREQMGVAFSTDMLHWERYPANPVLRNGPKGSYDEQFCSDGKVFRDGDHWVMLYFGVGRGGAHIMAAFSRDLLHWTRDPEPLYKAGGNPSGLDRRYAHKISLVYNPKNDTFYMYYCAVGDKGRGIGLITSRPLR